MSCYRTPMLGRQWSVLALLAALGCNEGQSGAADTEAMCEGYGEDPDPCCCYPEPAMPACDQLQLCPTIEADCEDGMLGDGACTLDQASDGAVTCALTALGDPASRGSISWTTSELSGSRVSTATLHLGGSRAAMNVTTVEDGDERFQAFAGDVPDDFDAAVCTVFDTPGARFECMLNATALQSSLTCHDVTLPES